MGGGGRPSGEEEEEAARRVRALLGFGLQRKNIHNQQQTDYTTAADFAAFIAGATHSKHASSSSVPSTTIAAFLTSLL